MKKSKDRLPDRGNPYNGYGYPQSGYPQQNNGYQNGYGGYQQDGYPQNGYPQQNNGYQNGYGGYGGYGGYPGYGYGGYPGYGYPGYGYGGYPGYGYGGYGGYPQMNYIADNYPQEDYGNPHDPTDKSVRPDAPAQATPQSEGKSEKVQTGNPAPSEASAESAAQPAPQETQEKRAETPSPAEEPKPQDSPSAGAAEGEEQQNSRQTANTESAGAAAGSEDVETLKAEAADLKRKWYSVTAEYDNYRKRTQNSKLEAYQEGRADIVKKLFPIGDNLDRAVKSCQDETTKKGINMVLSAFEKLLETENITVIDPEGKPFDPNECEAIMAVDAEEGQESGIVTEVYVKGYAQNDKVLRYAQVVVTK